MTQEPQLISDKTENSLKRNREDEKTVGRLIVSQIYPNMQNRVYGQQEIKMKTQHFIETKQAELRTTKLS